MDRSVKIVIVAFVTGVILIIAGQSLYRYANQTMADLEMQLSTGSLSQSEINALEGSLSWWRNATLSTYGPTSIALIATGIAVLTTLTAYFGWTILRSRKTK